MQIMKFEDTIKAYLDRVASEDDQFAEKYANPKKSVEECCKYIFQEVEKQREKQKCVAVADEEVYGLAIHYYDEEDLVVDGPKAKVEVAKSEEPAPAESPENEVTVMEEEPSEKKPKARKPRKEKAKPKAKEEEVDDDDDIPLPFDVVLF